MTITYLTDVGGATDCGLTWNPLNVYTLKFYTPSICGSSNKTIYLTFRGPCIANILAEYNQQDATFHNLCISVIRFTRFRRFFPSIIRSPKLHIQRQLFVRPLLLPAASLAGPD